MIFTPRIVFATAAVFAVVAFIGLLFTFERPGAIVSQTGYRGVAMEQNYNPRTLVAQQARNQPPEAIEKVDPDGQKASEVYQNVKVLGDLTEVEFLRTMTAIPPGCRRRAAAPTATPRGRSCRPTASTPRSWRGGCCR